MLFDLIKIESEPRERFIGVAGTPEYQGGWFITGSTVMRQNRWRAVLALTASLWEQWNRIIIFLQFFPSRLIVTLIISHPSDFFHGRRPARSLAKHPSSTNKAIRGGYLKLIRQIIKTGASWIDVWRILIEFQGVFYYFSLIIFLVRLAY